MVLSLLLAAALAFTDADAAFAYKKAEEFTKNHVPRNAGTVRSKLAANWILDNIAMVGGNTHIEGFFDVTPTGEKRFVNVVYEFKVDPDRPWVELISHYDTKGGVPGANDGASTTALLIALCSVLEHSSGVTCNVRIVWTDGEECLGATYSETDGFHGSKYEAQKIKSLNRKVKAVICVDMLGDKDLQLTIPTNSDARLAKIAELCSQKTPDLPKNFIKRGDKKILDDHDAFEKVGYPSLLLIDCEYGSAAGLNDYWHTSQDTLDKISVDSLKKSGKLITAILNVLL